MAPQDPSPPPLDRDTSETDIRDLSTAPPPGPEPAATRIGPYRILELIGEGGMGVVYLAEQERPIRRRVALKLVKLGMDTRQVVARFEAERQALAMMDHPSIARVYDAGSTEQGRPYFVMEHVAGVRITDYCDRHRLTTRARLELFVQVCHAVQHAHQKAIIHRDLKPSNLLVTVRDGTPVPKVIDFGVAKATAFRLSEQTVYTELGQMIGTPDYMSPEQAEMTGLNVDTRTDIYALGVVLYELLAGVLPFDTASLRQEGFEGVRRILRDKEPPRPSTRVSQLGGTASRTAERRRTTAPGLRRQLRGELDWITMRAMEKDRTRRYQTASEFAADIERYLAGEPVLAGPPSRIYWLRKQAARHKWPLAAALVILAAIVTLGSVSLWQGRRARAEGIRARTNAILASAAAAQDPFVKALLVRELAGTEGLTPAEFSKAQSVLGAPLPIADVGEEDPAWEGGQAVTAAVSPDGSRVAVVSADGSVSVWSASGAGEPIVLKGHDRRELVSELGLSPLYCVGFSPDGSRIVTCGWDRTARIWPAGGGEPVVLRGHGARVLRAEFDREGRRVVTASSDDTARIWRTDGAGDPIVLAHPDEVLAASFSPDGAMVVTASADGSVRVWPADRAATPRVITGPGARVASVAFSPDGRRVLAALEDGTARVHAVDGGSAPVVLRGHTDRVTHAAFDPEGRLIVTASADRTARVWMADGTGELSFLPGHREELSWAGFSPDGTRILTASADGTARIWEPIVRPSLAGNVAQSVPAGPFRGRKVRFRAKLRVEPEGGTASAHLWLRVDPGGIFVSTSERPTTSSQWSEHEISGDVKSDAYQINLGMILRGSGRAWMDAAHLEVVDGVADGGPGLVDGGFEASRLRWIVYHGRGYAEGDGGYRARTVEERPAEGERSVMIESRPYIAYQSRLVASHGRGIRWASFAAGGRRVMTAPDDGTARMWDPDRRAEPLVLDGHEATVVSAAFSPDGERIVTASTDRTARVWRADGTLEPIVLKGHEGSVQSAAFSPDGGRIVTASTDGTTRVWRADGTLEPIVLKGHEDAVQSAAFSPDGGRIVTASSDRTVRIWRADGTLEPIVLKGHEGAVYSAAFSPDGGRIVTASSDATARVWQADGTEPAVILKGHESTVFSAAFSPDGRRIVTSSRDRTARVWQAEGTSAPVVLQGHRAHVHTAAFSPDGKRIVTSSRDGVAAVWQADGGGEPVVLKGHEGVVWSAAFSPDGRRVVTASSDGTARVWRVTWDGVLEYLEANIDLCLEPEARMQFLGEVRSTATDRFTRCEHAHGRTPGRSQSSELQTSSVGVPGAGNPGKRP